MEIAVDDGCGPRISFDAGDELLEALFGRGKIDGRKLAGDRPGTFLLESAEQGQRVGRWSFLGFRPRAVIRLDRGAHTDPYALVAEELERYRIAPLAGLPPFAGGAVGLFGYDLVRTAETLIMPPSGPRAAPRSPPRRRARRR